MRLIWMLLCGLLGTAIPAAPAFGQGDHYPSRPLRVIIPFAPGGASDFIGRILQPKLAEVLGQQVVVDNRAGASGNIGVETAARATPDGYTFLLGNVSSMGINPSMFPNFHVRCPVISFRSRSSSTSRWCHGKALHTSGRA